jgi:hypothetical protein
MNKDGEYIFAATHNIQEDVPPQNLIYMLEAAKNIKVIQWRTQYEFERTCNKNIRI